MTKPLWEYAPSGREIKIPILGVCGEFGSGKTLFALTIAPGNHPEGHAYAGQSRTLVIDLEKSSETYEGGALGFERIDLPALLMKEQKEIYKPIDLYNRFLKIIDSVPDGRYDVIITDPITDIDTGLADYIRENHAKFGLTSNQLTKMPNLMWGVLKEHWNKVLLQIAQKCQTFVFVAHMGDEYCGKEKSGKRIPKGKETLGKLATLYLQMMRTITKKNGVVEKFAIPCARITMDKGRLCDTTISETGEVVIRELLPPGIKDCTPNRIRELIRKPFAKRTVFPEDTMSDETRLMVELQIEQAKNETAQANLELAKRQEEIRNMPKSPTPTPLPSPPVQNVANALSLPPPPTAPTPAISEKPKPEDTPPPEEEKITSPPVVCDQQKQIDNIKQAHLGGAFNKDELAIMLKNYKCTKLSELSTAQLNTIHENVTLLESILYEAKARGIHRSKIDELARFQKGKSALLCNTKAKENILTEIRKEPVLGECELPF